MANTQRETTTSKKLFKNFLFVWQLNFTQNWSPFDLFFIALSESLFMEFLLFSLVILILALNFFISFVGGEKFFEKLCHLMLHEQKKTIANLKSCRSVTRKFWETNLDFGLHIYIKSLSLYSIFIKKYVYYK